MGALTSKPYAFHGRYWEVIDHDIFDTSDSLIVPVKAGLRGNDFLRVLPSVFSSKHSSGEWISDKTRFSYFGFKYQRLTRPLLRSSFSGKFAPVSWRVAISTALTQLERSSCVSFFLGQRVDLETCFSLKLLTSTLPAARFSVVGSDFPQNFMGGTFEQSDFALRMASGLDFSDSTFSLFVSYEFDSSLPILDYYFKQTFPKSSSIFTLGSNVSSSNLPNVFSLGLSTRSFSSFFRGKSKACRVMAKSKNPYVFFSSSSMTPTLSAFFAFFKSLSFFFKTGYSFSSNLVVLPCTSTSTNFLEVFGAPKFGGACFSAHGPKLNYFVDYSTYAPRGPSCVDFSIFQGSNFNSMLSFTNLVLPTPFPLEDSGTYSDIFGCRKFSIGLPTKLASDVRSSYKIFLHLYSLRLSQVENMSISGIERTFSALSDSSANLPFFVSSSSVFTDFSAFNSHHYTYTSPVHSLRSDLLSSVSAPLMLQAKMFVDNRSYVHFF